MHTVSEHQSRRGSAIPRGGVEAIGHWLTTLWSKFAESSAPPHPEAATEASDSKPWSLSEMMQRIRNWGDAHEATAPVEATPVQATTGSMAASEKVINLAGECATFRASRAR